MRKQRKMGHITIVGRSMGKVEKALNAMLNDEISDSQSAGNGIRVVLQLCFGYEYEKKNVGRNFFLLY